MQCCVRDHKHELVVAGLQHAAGQLIASHSVVLGTSAQLEVGPKARDTKQNAGFQMVPLRFFVCVFIPRLPCNGEASGTRSPHPVVTPADTCPSHPRQCPCLSVGKHLGRGRTSCPSQAAECCKARLARGRVLTSACSGSSGAAAFRRQAASTNLSPASVLTRVSTALSCCRAEKARTSASSRACRWVHPLAGGGLIRTEGPVGSHCVRRRAAVSAAGATAQRAPCRHQSMVTLLAGLGTGATPVCVRVEVG